jgi:hypothetical protein
MMAADGVVRRSWARPMRLTVILAIGLFVAGCGSSTGTPTLSALPSPAKTIPLASAAAGPAGSAIRVAEVAPGECFDFVVGSYDAIVRSCADPHNLEQITLIPIDAPLGAPYPEDDQVARLSVGLRCGEAFAGYVGRPDTDSIYNFYISTITESEWAAGERRVSCAAGLDQVRE